MIIQLDKNLLHFGNTLINDVQKTAAPITDFENGKQYVFDIRANLLVPTQEHIQHEFHTDRKVPHKVALFYVTECNGFTILKDTTEVKCTENRMLIFDGSIEHCSVTSTDQPRSVININYVSNT